MHHGICVGQCRSILATLGRRGQGTLHKGTLALLVHEGTLHNRLHGGEQTACRRYRDMGAQTGRALASDQRHHVQSEAQLFVLDGSVVEQAALWRITGATIDVLS